MNNSTRVTEEIWDGIPVICFFEATSTGEKIHFKLGEPISKSYFEAYGLIGKLKTDEGEVLYHSLNESQLIHTLFLSIRHLSHQNQNFKKVAKRDLGADFAEGLLNFLKSPEGEKFRTEPELDLGTLSKRFPRWSLVHFKTQEVAEVGDTIWCDKEPYVLAGGQPPKHDASTGRICCRSDDDDTEFNWFPSVVGLKWVPNRLDA